MKTPLNHFLATLLSSTALATCSAARLLPRLCTLPIGLGLMLAGEVMAQTFTTLHNFAGTSDGANLVAGLVLSGNTLYGTAFQGGSSDNGTVFRVNTDGTGFTNLHSFTALAGQYPTRTNSDGASPSARLALSGNTLYGTTYFGGTGGRGTLFAVNTDGTGFTNLHSFSAGSGSLPGPITNDDGAVPRAGLIISGNTLYGTTAAGGASAAGTVFKVNTDGTGFANLYNFTALPPSPPYTNSDGGAPYARLVLAGDTLYGTTYYGGTAGNGTLFALNTDGTGFTNLHSFTAGSGSLSSTVTNSDGAGLFAGLILSGNTLYGTAAGGGSAGCGTVFKVNTNGTDFTTLHDFPALSGPPPYPNSDGAGPRGELALSGSKLYGTAYVGGTSGNGTVFALSTDGTGFINLHSFSAIAWPDYTNSDGQYPAGGLILSGNTLYGAASFGGSSDDGTVFSFVLIPEGLAYTTNNGAITITSYTGPGGDVTIPDTITDLPVRSIGAIVFAESIGLTSVTIGNSVTNIGEFAFQTCFSLTNVSLPNAITTIANGLFAGCTNLPSITIPDTVSSIGQSAFVGCRGLTGVTIPNSVVSIGNSAFANCPSLTNATIGTNVALLGNSAFYACISLTSITVPDSVSTLGDAVFTSCIGLTNIVIGNGVTNIGNAAFQFCPRLTAAYFQGNPPSLGSSVFDSDDDATVYYLPGTIGWGPTYGLRPTAVWQPEILTRDTAFGVQTDHFGFNIAWASGMNIAVDACPDLVNPIWLPLQTNTLAGDTFYFSDPDWTNYPRRFYRVRWPGPQVQ